VAFEAAGEIQFEQRHLDGPAARAGQADDLVDRHRRWAEQFFDGAQCVRAVHCLQGLVAFGRGADAAFEWTECFDRVSGVLDQGRTVADQLVAALRSAASRAVISDPDRGAASTTTVPLPIPAMIRLR
jgi:hypothetical protein